MSKKSTGLLALVAGVAAGAAALFLSKKENRDKVAKTSKEISRKVKANKTVKKVAAQTKVLAQKTAVASKKAIKTVKKAKTVATTKVKAVAKKSKK